MTLEEQIQELKKTLTGDLMNDCETHNEIYKLKQQIAIANGITVEQYDSENNEQCEACGS